MKPADRSALAVTTSDEEQRLEAAAAWFARLSAETASDEDRAAFAAWRDADPRNAAADAEMRGIWQASASFERREPAAPVRILPRRRLAASIAVVALLAGSAALWLERGSKDGAYHTAAGEQRALHLADGSVVTLNTATDATAEIRDQTRHVDLRQGELFLQVAPDKARPFTVTAGTRTVRVVGTSFSVLRIGSRVAVRVAEGKVEVSGAGKTTALTPGQQVTFGDEGGSGNVEPISPRSIAAWRQGMLIYERQRLSDVAADLSRYGERKLRVRRASDGDVMINVVLRLEDLDSMLAALSKTLPIATERQADGSIQLDWKGP